MTLTGTPLLLIALAAAAAPEPPEKKDAPKPSDNKGATINYEALLNDRMSKGITPETNANVPIWKALGPTPEGAKMPAEFFRRLGIPEPPEDGDYFVGLGTYLRDRAKLTPDDMNALIGRMNHFTQRPWAAADFPHVAKWLEVNEKPLALVAEAATRPYYYNPLVSNRGGKEPGGLMGALLPSVQKCRELATALTARAMLRVADGKADAWQDLLTAHRLGRLVARGGTLIEFLVGVAIDQVATTADLAYLERADLTAAQILTRQKDLRALPPMPPVADKIDLAERHTFLDSLQMVRKVGFGVLVNLAGEPNPKFTPAETTAWEKVDWEPAVRAGSKWYDRLGAALRKPTRAERVKELAKIDEELKALKREAVGMKAVPGGKDPPGAVLAKQVGDILVVLLMPAVTKVQDASDRSEQVRQNLQVAFALAAYWKDKGQYPAKLGDLSPKYLKDVPNDLFADKELTYRPDEKGYTLYSVGVNGKDEDGRSYSDSPPGDDLSVRIPLPALKDPAPVPKNPTPAPKEPK